SGLFSCRNTNPIPERSLCFYDHDLAGLHSEHYALSKIPRMRITLRPASPEDQDFLFRLYAGTRQEELAPFGWPPAQQEMFLRMQFSAQQRWYGEAYGQASHHIILLDEKPIGRI